MAAKARQAARRLSGLRREVKYGRNSRIDLLLECAKKGLCYVEIKNVHLSRRHGLAEFPDSVTARGAKHLAEMSDMVREGHRAVMVFLIQRERRQAAGACPRCRSDLRRRLRCGGGGRRRGDRTALQDEHGGDRGGQAGAHRRLRLPACGSMPYAADTPARPQSHIAPCGLVIVTARNTHARAHMASDATQTLPRATAAISETQTLLAVSAAHLISHLHIMMLPVLLPLLKERLGVGFFELGPRAHHLQRRDRPDPGADGLPGRPHRRAAGADRRARARRLWRSCRSGSSRPIRG